MKHLYDDFYLVSPKYEFPVQTGDVNQVVVKTEHGYEWQHVDPIEYEKLLLDEAGYDWSKLYPKEENCPFYCTKCGIGV